MKRSLSTRVVASPVVCCVTSDSARKKKLVECVEAIGRLAGTGKAQQMQSLSFSDKIECTRSILRETKTALGILYRERNSAALTSMNATSSTSVANPENRIICNTYCAALLPNNKEWILTKVLRYYPTAQIVVVCDEDDDNNAVHNVKASNVIPIGDYRSKQWIADLKPENYVLALYPDTSTFYPGIIDSLDPSDSEYVHIRFDGEEPDDDGVAVKKKVATKFIAKRLIKK
jgi:hypothetical protein